MRQSVVTWAFPIVWLVKSRSRRATTSSLELGSMTTKPAMNRSDARSVISASPGLTDAGAAMFSRKTHLIFAACLASLFFSPSFATERISWNSLRPMDQRGALLPPSESVPDEVVAKSLTWPINGPAVELTGFLLPIDQEGELVYEFMLVPWAGACSHGAAPPPNQMVHVFPAQPYRISRIYEPIVVSGRLKPGID
ncbi:hypothetical protein EV291_13329 [Rhizobium sp. BK068]|nr:hypothetical protein EV291_13329 [Rhizobium sp. BK068]